MLPQNYEHHRHSLTGEGWPKWGGAAAEQPKEGREHRIAVTQPRRFAAEGVCKAIGDLYGERAAGCLCRPGHRVNDQWCTELGYWFGWKWSVGVTVGAVKRLQCAQFQHAYYAGAQTRELFFYTVL